MVMVLNVIVGCKTDDILTIKKTFTIFLINKLGATTVRSHNPKVHDSNIMLAGLRFYDLTLFFFSF